MIELLEKCVLCSVVGVGVSLTVLLIYNWLLAPKDRKDFDRFY